MTQRVGSSPAGATPSSKAEHVGPPKASVAGSNPAEDFAERAGAQLGLITRCSRGSSPPSATSRGVRLAARTRAFQARQRRFESGTPYHVVAPIWYAFAEVATRGVIRPPASLARQGLSPSRGMLGVFQLRAPSQISSATAATEAQKIARSAGVENVTVEGRRHRGARCTTVPAAT